MIRIMVIGGTDCSGGAGLSRDAAIATLNGAEICPVVTAVTAQTNGAVLDMLPVSSNLIIQQIEAALSTWPQAIKIGMLGSTAAAAAVARALAEHDLPLVLDPVMKASSGGSLMAGGFPPDLLRRTSLITPNLEEAAALTGRALPVSEQDILATGQGILDQGPQAVLIKGGHGKGPLSTDHLIDRAAQTAFNAPRSQRDMRGTGCALATAITCHLAAGSNLTKACDQAKSQILAMLQ